MTKIRDIKFKIEDLGITINETITIQVLNSLDSSFRQFLGILSYKTREKEIFLTLESQAKSLKDKKLWMKNHNTATANYTKWFPKKKSKPATADIRNSSASKCKFCEKELGPDKCWYLQAECHYYNKTSHIDKFYKKKVSFQTSSKQLIIYT